MRDAYVSAMVRIGTVTGRRALAACVMFVLCQSGTALADDAETLAARYAAWIEACIAGADFGTMGDCKGALATPCMEAEEAGYSTLGMVFCAAAETTVWDRHLNEEYRKTLAWAEALDESDRETFPEFARRVETLRAAQRAWIVFRDAECDLDYAVWGAGSMRQIAGSSCMMEMTADRVVDLIMIRSTMR